MRRAGVVRFLLHWLRNRLMFSYMVLGILTSWVNIYVWVRPHSSKLHCWIFRYVHNFIVWFQYRHKYSVAPDFCFLGENITEPFHKIHVVFAFHIFIFMLKVFFEMHISWVLHNVMLRSFGHNSFSLNWCSWEFIWL